MRLSIINYTQVPCPFCQEKVSLSKLYCVEYRPQSRLLRSHRSCLRPNVNAFAYCELYPGGGCIDANSLLSS
uniref:Uncharacterized protein n=1 Tax=Utricularia reniformis TaxID=192314 RepID=A0A1Y0B091_9LAMI|nr:hypothetical protein AEK19_MT0597 [Utricularia reniformis]ART30852.1 hypothetical protein AEK19_MT0597 [Utricularia reniformis]